MCFSKIKKLFLKNYVVCVVNRYSNIGRTFTYYVSGYSKNQLVKKIEKGGYLVLSISEVKGGQNE